MVAIEEPVAGWGGGVYTLNGRARFSVDDEGDAARFCSDDPALLATVRAGVAQVNADARELGRAMGEAKAYELECLEAARRARMAARSNTSTSANQGESALL